MLIVRFFRCEVYTTPKAAGSEKLRHELYVCEANSGDQEIHGQKRNIHRKPFRNLKKRYFHWTYLQNLLLPIVHTTIEKWIVH